jgi:putative transposase
LGKLGIKVSERTVSRLLRGQRRPPSQTWRTFLTNHVATLASMDFFTVPTVTGRVLFVLVLLTHQRRRLVHVNITEHPTEEWTAQQIVDAFPDEAAPTWLCEMAMPSMVTRSGAESPAWVSARSSQVRQARGRTRMSSG